MVNTFETTNVAWFPTLPLQQKEVVTIPPDNDSKYDPVYGYLLHDYWLMQMYSILGLDPNCRSEVGGIDQQHLLEDRIALMRAFTEIGITFMTHSTEDDLWTRCCRENGGTILRGKSIDKLTPKISKRDVRFVYYTAPQGKVIAVAKSHIRNYGSVECYIAEVLDLEPRNVVALCAPTELIPHRLPGYNGAANSLLTDWIDTGYAIYPDAEGNPCLLIDGKIEYIASITGKKEELDKFIRLCSDYFWKVVFVSSKCPWLSSVNGFYANEKILLSSNITDEDIQRLANVLRRDIHIVDTTFEYSDRAGLPGMRCIAGSQQIIDYIGRH